MELSLTGKVIKILEPLGGVSAKGKEWVKYGFVIETSEQYPRTIALSCTNKEKWEKWGIKVGNEYQMSINISSREWNGKWFTDVEVWRLVIFGNVSGNKEEVKGLEQQSSEEVNDDGVPF